MFIVRHIGIFAEEVFTITRHTHSSVYKLSERMYFIFTTFFINIDIFTVCQLFSEIVTYDKQGILIRFFQAWKETLMYKCR